MAKLSEGAANEFVGVIAKDVADGGSDVEEGTLEGDDMEKVRRAVEDEHVKRLVAIVGIETDGLGGAVGEGDSGGRVSGGRKLKRSGEGRVDQEGAELFG